MICDRCLNGRHVRCTDPVGCTCSVCASRPASKPARRKPAPSESRPARESRHATRAPRITGPGTECQVDGCTDIVDTKGYCHLHYRRVLKHGDPLHVTERAPFRLLERPPVELLDFDLIPRPPGCTICGQRRGHWPGCPKG